MATPPLQRLQTLLHRFGDANDGEAENAFGIFRSICRSQGINPVELTLSVAGSSSSTVASYTEHKQAVMIAELQARLAAVDAERLRLAAEVARLRQVSDRKGENKVPYMNDKLATILRIVDAISPADRAAFIKEAARCGHADPHLWYLAGRMAEQPTEGAPLLERRQVKHSHEYWLSAHGRRKLKEWQRLAA